MNAPQTVEGVSADDIILSRLGATRIISKPGDGRLKGNGQIVHPAVNRFIEVGKAVAKTPEGSKALADFKANRISRKRFLEIMKPLYEEYESRLFGR
jgi:hypothetical protein